MKNPEDQLKEKWDRWNSKADTLLKELRACRGGYKEIEEEMTKRIEEIFEEYTQLLKEGIRILPLGGKIKIGLRIIRARFNHKLYRMKWTLLKVGRLMMGMDI